jgi:hypothetical protein
MRPCSLHGLTVHHFICMHTGTLRPKGIIDTHVQIVTAGSPRSSVTTHCHSQLALTHGITHSLMGSRTHSWDHALMHDCMPIIPTACTVRMQDRVTPSTTTQRSKHAPTSAIATRRATPSQPLRTAGSATAPTLLGWLQLSRRSGQAASAGRRATDFHSSRAAARGAFRRIRSSASRTRPPTHRGPTRRCLYRSALTTFSLDSLPHSSSHSSLKTEPMSMPRVCSCQGGCLLRDLSLRCCRWRFWLWFWLHKVSFRDGWWSVVCG